MTNLNKRIADIPIPERLRGFPLNSEGYPIPYFVPYVEGLPEFRAMDPEKFTHAVRHRKCWLCGQTLGKHMTFPIGPMCAITRTTAEPPSHLACAEYAVKACPFLSQPRMRRNERDLPEHITSAGIGIKRNPGVTVLWTTLSYKLFKSGGYLFRVGDPEHAEVYAQGRAASPREVAESIFSGYPILQAEARRDGPEAEEELAGYYAKGLRVLGLSPELMYITEKEMSSDHSRSGHGRATSSEDDAPPSPQHPGAEQLAAPQPLCGAEVQHQQGGGGPGHPVQAGAAGQGGCPMEEPRGGRNGLFSEGARRVSLGSKRVTAGAMAIIRKIHST